jgi:hypothetical protein
MQLFSSNKALLFKQATQQLTLYLSFTNEFKTITCLGKLLGLQKQMSWTSTAKGGSKKQMGWTSTAKGGNKKKMGEGWKQKANGLDQHGEGGEHGCLFSFKRESLQSKL